MKSKKNISEEDDLDKARGKYDYSHVLRITVDPLLALLDVHQGEVASHNGCGFRAVIHQVASTIFVIC